MSDDKKPIPIGALRVDCSDMAEFIEDLAPGELVGKHGAQEGFEEAAMEILSNQEAWGSRVGVTDDDIQTLELANHRIAMIDKRLPAARKLVEMLEETRGKLDHERHRQVFEIAALVDARSKLGRSPELLARYEKARAYRSAMARKAVKTRRKNEELMAANPPDTTLEQDAMAPAAEPAAWPEA